MLTLKRPLVRAQAGRRHTFSQVFYTVSLHSKFIFTGNLSLLSNVLYTVSVNSKFIFTVHSKFIFTVSVHSKFIFTESLHN